MESTRKFDANDFRFMKSITFDELADKNYITDMINFISTLDKRAAGGKIVILDSRRSENTEVYTYKKFIEIYDKSGADGFIKY